MSSNRQQLATGLKAILGGANGAARENVPMPAPVDVLEERFAQPEPAEKITPTKLESAPAPIVSRDMESAELALPAPASIQTAPSARGTKSKRKAEAEPVFVQPGQRVGTLDRPYVRQRDNQATRKVGVVLPVDLAERLQIHCVKTRTRPNAFVEQAILEALERLG